MTKANKYIPLADRINQDVWHDNFVPKYSALASAPPTRLVLVGVWLIFVPFTIGTIAIIPAVLSDSPDPLTALISVSGPLLFAALSIAVLVSQTRRYFSARTDSATDPDDGPEDPEE